MLQANELKLAILKNHQIQAAAQNHQLVGLVAMTEQLGVSVGRHVRDQRFMADEGITEKGDSCV
ncbi:hypothetical protein SynMITS9220_01876 [Synechococcus sp. MIT S9220]|nr:hypothetical protein SynMITS9220_01876 [Synechococcus sp. MIT S9220]